MTLTTILEVHNFKLTTQVILYLVSIKRSHYFLIGFGHVPDAEVNFNRATQFCANDGRQMNMNSFVQDNGQNITMNQLLGTQVQSSS